MQETQLGRSSTLWNFSSVEGVVRDPWRFAVIFICKQMSLIDGISGDVHLASGM